jgi:hypothetical protein
MLSGVVESWGGEEKNRLHTVGGKHVIFFLPFLAMLLFDVPCIIQRFTSRPAIFAESIAPAGSITVKYHFEMPPRTSKHQESSSNNEKPITAKSNKRNELNDQRQRVDLTKLKDEAVLLSDCALRQMEDPLAQFLARPAASVQSDASTSSSSRS